MASDFAGDDASDYKESCAASTSPSYRFKDPWAASFLDNAKLFTVQLLYAGGSGALAKTAVAPLERVKILLQVQPMSSTPVHEQYRGLRDALWRIPHREGGWKAYFRGNGANVLRLGPEALFRFVVHDQFKIMFSPADGSPLGITGKLAAGAATGVLKTALVYPLDLCRTRITSDLTGPGQPRRYLSVRDTVYWTVRREGILGLYKGFSLSLLGVVPYLTISFTAYDDLKAHLPEDLESQQQWWFPWLKMGCGAGAGVIAQTLTYPLDTVRRRIQLSGALGQALSYPGYFHCAWAMWRKEGLASFYRGVGVNAIKTVPGAAIQFVAYDLIKCAVIGVYPAAGASPPL